MTAQFKLFHRQFWLLLLVFAVLTAMAYSLSRFISAYSRAQYMKNQASLIISLVSTHQGDPVPFARDLRKRMSDLQLPFDIDVIQNGKSLLSGEAFVSLPFSEDEVQVEQAIGGPGSPTIAVTLRPSPYSRRNVAVTFICLFLAVFIASTFSVFLLYSNFRDKAELAKDVFSRIQQGDLKARFSTSRLDEFGQVLVLFNAMASEIERLVDRLKEKEKTRVHLLQELTHDLRTPVSSLNNLLESLRFSGAGLNEKAREELTDLAYQETEYLTRLVEDLLFLALVLEPKYKTESHEVDLRELLENQVNLVAAKHTAVQGLLNGGGSFLIRGNTHQLRRLMRNALENSFSFARSKVEIQLRETARELHISINDDGPGFSDAALANFGRKRGTRYQSSQAKDRLSVGLGSVIMQAIVTAHGGRLSATNLIGPGGVVLGSHLSLSLPKSNDEYPGLDGHDKKLEP